MERHVLRAWLRRLPRTPHLRGVERERALALAAVAVCLFALVPPFAGIAWLFGDALTTWVVVFDGVLALGVLALLRRGQPKLGAFTLLTAYLASMTTLALLQGGLRSALPMWLAVLPVIALLLVGGRAALRWGLSACAVISALAIAFGFGIEVPDTTSLAERRILFGLTFAVGPVLAMIASLLYARIEHRARERERRAHERLARAHAELQRAWAAARSAAEVKRRFLANVSHELRTPMNGVIGMTEIILDGALAPEQRDAMLVLRHSAERMMEGVESLLAFTAVEQGRLRPVARPIALGPVLEHCAARHREHCAAKGLTFSIDLDASLPDQVAVDPMFLSAALSPLLSNAVKFTHEGEVRLTARAVDGAVHVEVHDSGRGIGPELLGRLFRPFSQGDDSLTRSHEGFGLGLSVASGLAACIGGRVSVEPRASGGSTFTLSLPVVAP